MEGNVIERRTSAVQGAWPELKQQHSYSNIFVNTPGGVAESERPRLEKMHEFDRGDAIQVKDKYDGKMILKLLF